MLDKIKITENDIRYMVSECITKIVSEDVHYSSNGTNTIDVSIKSDGSYDHLDDRMFRKKSDILDKDFMDKVNTDKATREFYSKIIAKMGECLRGKRPKCFDSKASQTAFERKMNFFKFDDGRCRYDGKTYANINAMLKNVIQTKVDEEGNEEYIVPIYNGKGGFKGEKPKSFKDRSKAEEFVESNLEDRNSIINWASIAAERDTLWQNMRANKVDRLAQYNDEDKVANYEIINLPNSNVKTLALWGIDDFNFTDALKHGTMRQNDMTDKYLKISPDDRATDTKLEGGIEQLSKIPVTYDGGLKPNVKQNFSLDGFDVENMPNYDKNKGREHYRQQYGMSDRNYTSIAQFLDKSVQYAAYTLKDYGFMPTYILSVPSSSKYNLYYCTNLSSKLGVPYISDFFLRDVVNVKYDKEAILKKGFSNSEILGFEDDVKKAVFAEIGSFIKKPISVICKKHAEELNKIGDEYGLTYNSFIPYIAQNIYRYFREYNPDILNDDIKAKMMQNILSETKALVPPYIPPKDRGSEEAEYKLSQYKMRVNRLNRMKEQLTYFINSAALEDFQNAIQQVAAIMEQYKAKLDAGYELNLYSKAFKITNVNKRFRQYLKNVYVVNANYTTTDKNRKGALLKAYANPNSKFLIFDEDINSGGSLLLTVNSFRDQLIMTRQYEQPDKSYDEIYGEVTNELPDKVLCLVNAYSAKGV